jgi:hypothetical protein
MESHYSNATMISDQSKILSAQKAEKEAFQSLLKDVKDIAEANPALQVIHRLWTRPNLIKQSQFRGRVGDQRTEGEGYYQGRIERVE